LEKQENFTHLARIYSYFCESMKIAVIGCGWLGLPLAKRLIDLGHEVHGSTTRDAHLSFLANNGIQGFVYDGSSQTQLSKEVKESEIAIFNFPPSRSADYAAQVSDLAAQFSPKTKLIFTSSTGVYQDLEGPCNELAPIIATHPVFLAEEAIRFSTRKFTILRLAGLISEDRNPIKYLSGKQNTDGQKVVNLVHREDVIAAILTVLKHEVWEEIFNVCYPAHPTRASYYTDQAEKREMLPPSFTFSLGNGKEINSFKMVQDLKFTYRHSI
jgi:nucleoside-diphosphate-sugar epimerase